MQAEREAKARATILEMVGDIPDADIAPPENVLFVCKLNPVTTDDDLEIIFSRFGKIKSCEVIRDRKSGDSLQYAFIEFENQKSCEDAYFKMANVLIDDRRIHVDFSQSVSKVKWLGKGRVTHYDEKGNRSKSGGNRDIGKGNYKVENQDRKRRPSPLEDKRRKKSRSPQRSRTPKSRDNFRRDYKDSRRRESPNRRQHCRSLDEEQHLSRRTKGRDGKSPRRFRSPRRRSRSRRRYSPHRSPERRNKPRDNKYSEVERSQSDRKSKSKRSSSEDELEKRSKHNKKPTKVEKKEVRRTKKQSSESSSSESDSSSEALRSKKKKRTETKRRTGK